MAAWQRYDGSFYQAARSVLPDLVGDGRLLILSGGYGVLDGRDPIGYYNRRLRTGGWPRGLLEQNLADRAATQGLNVVAVAGTTTDYSKLIRRTQWDLPAGRVALLLTLRDVRGVSAVSAALGLALKTFAERRNDYPRGTVVEMLDA